MKLRNTYIALYFFVSAHAYAASQNDVSIYSAERNISSAGLPDLSGVDDSQNALSKSHIANSHLSDNEKRAATSPRQISLSEIKNMSVPIALGDGTAATISTQKFTWQHQAENLYSHVALGAIAPESRGFGLGAGIDVAYALAQQTILGTNIFLSPQRSEMVINGVHSLPFGLLVKGSWGYMWGKQDFDFSSGKKSVDLSQRGYAFEVKYNNKEWFKPLQNLGLSAWGAQAKQRSNEAPIYFQQQTASSYNIFLDSRKLAIGRLNGQSLNTQIAVSPNLVLQAALGREALTFPFSDGSQESSIKPFLEFKLHYEPKPDWRFVGQYQHATSGKKFDLSMQYLSWKLALMHQHGNNGIQGSDSVMLSYEWIPGRHRGGRSTLAEQLLPSAPDNVLTLLRDAATRPSVMPQSFLAKVDATASKKIMSICSNASIQGATLSPNGLFTIPVGSGVITINKALRNGEAFSYDGIFSAGNASFSIDLPKLPGASDTDIYNIEVSDGLKRYAIMADASLVKSLVCQ